MQDLAGRAAVVTGAGSGLGRAIALQCASAGMRVVLADIDMDGAHETEQAIRATGASVCAVATDVADPAALDRLADQAESAFGPVSLLCNNAGVMLAGPAWQTSVADWQWLLGINVMGVVHGIRSFVPRMIAHAQQAHVVNTASLAGLLSAPGMAVYSASKHAVVAISECLHHDLRLARAPIGVSVLCPGFVATRLTDPGRYVRPGADTPASAAIMRRLERQLARAPLSPDAIATQVLEAIRNDIFYVLTHEGSLPALDQHARALQENRPPPMVRI